MPNRARHLILATLLFPLPIIIIIPLVLISKFGINIPDTLFWGFWVAKVLIPLGISISGYAVTLFFIEGEGSPAPWCPPTKFMVTGPYRYMRNPMATGIILTLIAISSMILSAPIAIWTAIVFVTYTVYYIFIEEPGLQTRFGDQYTQYKANVNRWLPSFPGWTAPWLPVEGEEEDAKKAEDE